VATFAPHPNLRTSVVAIDVVENAAGEAAVLPSTSAVLGFQFRGRVRAGDGLLALAGVTGLQESARTYSYLDGTGSVLVRFTAQGAARLGVPPAQLANRSVSLDELVPRLRAEEVTERIAAAPDDASRVAVVEQFLQELPFARDLVVTRALERLSDPNGGLSLAAIAAELALSERQLERRFLLRVGMMPKRFARLARFQRAVSLLDSTPALAAVAQHAGYYDQSHFVREFRAFAGTPPAAWRGRR
jgi:AraC-like DNA-binding protein